MNSHDVGGATEDGWETVSNTLVYESVHLQIASKKVRSPARPEPHDWTVAHRKTAVVVAPMTEDRSLVLIRQERIPILATLWELPAGQIDHEQDGDTGSAEEVARRELREETGYEIAPGGELIPLGDFFSSPGFTDERAFLFLARPVQLSAGGPQHSESESILDCRTFTTAQISAMIAANEIRDANTLAVFARMVARGFLSLAG
ncbi:MAG: NUDIX hydrolase [Verrucomicrobiota bacterium]|nr:NUDIX hydrolase [Verrucomicrobiota bacterium]